MDTKGTVVTEGGRLGGGGDAAGTGTGTGTGGGGGGEASTVTGMTVGEMTAAMVWPGGALPWNVLVCACGVGHCQQVWQVLWFARVEQDGSKSCGQHWHPHCEASCKYAACSIWLCATQMTCLRDLLPFCMTSNHGYRKCCGAGTPVSRNLHVNSAPSPARWMSPG